jgi:sugar phosphate isomerase/epimerase
MIIGTEVGSLADVIATVQAVPGSSEGINFGSLRLSKHVRRIVDAGFRHIELALDTRFMMQGAADDSVIDELLELKKNMGLTYSVHLPIMDTSFMSLNDGIRKATLECLKESIRSTEPLDITGYVLHPTRFVEYEIAGLPLSASTKREVYKYIREKGSRGLSELIDLAGSSRRILLEPDVAIPFDAIFDPLVEEYDSGVCFDYGHHMMAKLDPIEFFETYKDRIREIHLHDVAVKYKIDHIPLGAGTTHWEDFVKYITRENRFDGVLLLEMMEQAAISSLPKLLKVIGI